MEQEGGDGGPGLRLFPTWPNVVIDDNNKTFELPYEMRFNGGSVLTIVFYSILLVVSAVGNITVLSIILKRRRTSTSRINTMLIHLAIADLMVTFLMMPLEIFWAATVAWWAGDAACRITAFFRIFGLYLSSFILICISIDRYFAVLKPMNLSDVDRRGKVMLTSAWVASILCSFPQVLVFHVERHPRLAWFEQCVTFHSFSTQTQELGYYFFSMFMMYALPLIVIIFSYASILTEIYRRSREPLNDRFRRSSLGFLGRARSRTLKMTITIVVVFFVCWTPYYVMCVWYWIFPESARLVDLKIQKALFLFACTNSCMNPIVYGAFNIRTRRRDPGQRNHTQESIHGAVDVVRLVTWRRTGSTPAPGAAIRDYCLSCRARQNNGCVVLLRTTEGVKMLSAQ